MFRPVLLNQLQDNLAKSILSHAETINKNDYLVVDQLHQSFNDNYFVKQKNAHSQAIEGRRKKIEDVKRMKLEEEERKRQEKIQRKTEKARLRKEKEIQDLKNSIHEEFLKKIDLVDMPENVFNINAYGQKKPYGKNIFHYISLGNWWLLRSVHFNPCVFLHENKRFHE